MQFLHEVHPSGKFCTKLCLDAATATDPRILFISHGCGEPQVLHLHRVEGLNRTLTSRCPVQHNLFVDLAKVQKVLSQGALFTTKTSAVFIQIRSTDIEGVLFENRVRHKDDM